MQRIKFNVSYDGTDYCGWQKQKHGMSVCEVIEKGLTKIFQQPIALFASGRTDAGVHAINQVCHFDVPENFLDPLFAKKWDFCWALNGQLPPAVTVKKAWLAPAEFHSTLSATHKTYRYWVFARRRPSPFMRRYSLWIRDPIDFSYLQSLSKYTLGTHDFQSFQSKGSPVTHTVRHIYQAVWLQKSEHLWEFRVTGNGFLKQMVRNIVGTQLWMEKKQAPLPLWSEILQAKDRKAAGPVAEPQGLALAKVYYPIELDNRCVEI